MSKRSARITAGAVATVVAVMIGATAANATPTPDSGPETGGTTVTIPEPAGVTFTSIAAGPSSFAIGADGNTYAWGANTYGQLGDGTTTNQRTPVQVQTPAGVTFTSITARLGSALAIGSDGNTYAWGANTYGQLGDGTTTDRSLPVLVQTPAGVTFTSVSYGQEFALALGSDGNIYSWGLNTSGRLGDGTTVNRSAPGLVLAPAGVTFTSVDAGYHHALAIGSDGNTYAWGNNSYGMLGDGTTTNRSAPVLVQAPAGVTFTSVSAGADNSLAVGSDGSAYSWGRNNVGQLGDGTFMSRSVPGPFPAPAGVSFTSVSAGESWGLAIGSDGNTYSWGHNGNGQLGDGTTTLRGTPVLVHAPAGVTFTSVSAGTLYVLAIDSDGDAYSWGFNGGGELGDGTINRRLAPVLVRTPDVVVTGVTFDGLLGTALVDNGDGTWSVVTPAHAPGPVDVVVSWTLGGVSQAPITYADGFTYTAIPVGPTITDPEDQSVADGDTATFSVVTTGVPTPTVTWEVSRDGGATWEPVSADPAATPSADGLTLSVIGTAANNGYQYRATAENGVGSAAVSAAAVLTVAPIPVTPTPTDVSPGGGLPVTGSESNAAVLLLGLAGLILGTGIIAARRTPQHRANR